MLNKKAPIGVMDSGLGGLSAVSALAKVLPAEDIVYFGDTANCPYGNKTNEELLQLSGNMLGFLEKQGVKCVALACNTTSALADILRQRFAAPIITVAESAADAVGTMGLKKVGLIATVSTVGSGIYERRIHAVDASVKVSSVGSVNLAALVEHTRHDDEALNEEIRRCMDRIVSPDLHHVILGCTHYPLILENFQSCYPGLEFIDPAEHQANSVKEFLQKEGGLNPEGKACMTIFTTGDTESFCSACEENGLAEHYRIMYHHI